MPCLVGIHSSGHDQVRRHLKVSELRTKRQDEAIGDGADEERLGRPSITRAIELGREPDRSIEAFAATTYCIWDEYGFDWGMAD